MASRSSRRRSHRVRGRRQDGVGPGLRPRGRGPPHGVGHPRTRPL